MNDDAELRDVSRIGPPMPRMSYTCGACGGTGWHDAGFADLSNTSTGSRCLSCAGSGRVWRDVAPVTAE